MIEAQGLTKRYGGKVAVDDLSFTVRPGHMTGFLRPNGAGKTTTMRMIPGLDRPTGGSVTVNGRPFGGVFSAMPRRRVERGEGDRRAGICPTAPIDRFDLKVLTYASRLRNR
jgi:ABC-type multidrug transport system ATPase subunit